MARDRVVSHKIISNMVPVVGYKLNPGSRYPISSSKVRHLKLWSHISNLAIFELPRSVIDHEGIAAFFIDTIGLVRVVKSGRVPLGEDETDKIC